VKKTSLWTAVNASASIFSGGCSIRFTIASASSSMAYRNANTTHHETALQTQHIMRPDTQRERGRGGGRERGRERVGGGGGGASGGVKRTTHAPSGLNGRSSARGCPSR
jgi:hypothetical protein